MKQLLLTILIAVGLTGCDSSKRKNYILLMDNSISIKEETIDKYIDVMQQGILPNMQKGDKLIVKFIDECSMIKSESIYNVDLAQLDFTSPNDGLNHKEDSAKARMKIYLSDSIYRDLERTIRKKRNERKECGQWTDIVNAINIASAEIDNSKSYNNKNEKVLNDAEGKENYSYQNVIIIFSDMVNEDPLHKFDFTKMQNLTSEQVQKKFDEVQDAKKVPKLKGTKIIVYGATATENSGAKKNEQIEKIHSFWDMYFASAGADLVAYDYDTENRIKEFARKQDE